MLFLASSVSWSMHAWIIGGQELGIVNCCCRQDADEIDAPSSDSLAGKVDPLSSLVRSSGVRGVEGVVKDVPGVVIDAAFGVESIEFSGILST